MTTNMKEKLENRYKELKNIDNKSCNNFNINDFNNLNDKDRLSNPIFKAYGYPSKIFYPNIQKFIRAYTKEGAVVLDSFCGSGTTGIAALIENRKAILFDNSPNAIHITKNTFAEIDFNKVEKTYKGLKKDLEEIINRLYSTETSDGLDGVAESIITSNIYSCRKCDNEIKLHNSSTGKRSEYKCLNCGEVINISKAEDKNRILARRVPVEVNIRIINGKVGRKTEKREVTKEDVIKWNKILEEYKLKSEHLWAPTEKVVYNRSYPRTGGWPGFPIDSKVSDLFPERNLIALKILYNYINEKISDVDTRDFFIFVFTESLFRSSKRLFTTSGIKTVYHVPPVGKEQNVLSVFDRKYKTIIKAKKYIYSNLVDAVSVNQNLLVEKQNAKDIPLEDNSIDYAFIDPPYGGVVPYAELNLFYSAWLKEEEDLDNEVIIPMDYDKKLEFVHDWGRQIEAAFSEVYRVLKPGAYFTIVFQSKFSEIWNELRDLMVNRIGFQFEKIVSNERSTTFHTNHLNDTNPQSAFITYRKPLFEETSVSVETTSSTEVSSVFRHISNEYFIEKRSFREVQSFIINLVHELGLERIPSDAEIKQWLNEFCNVNNNYYQLKKSK
ncbi:DNA methyltransferase [Oceanobacillus damuensis]|uniref:DNA methyltransferase n=1 Tax=Oceanobacillus damuensis TaxID=937928 RepID=UPI00083681CC|nr:DNA methyltransferase [Oceanobacillus damuensis]